MDTISRYIVSCDIDMTWDMISRYIATYHSISHQITPKQQRQTNPQPRCGLPFVLSLCLCPLLGLSFFRPAFFLVILRLFISGTHHRTDHTTSKQKQQPCPIRARSAPCAHVCFCFIYLCFFPLMFYFPVFFALFGTLSSYRYILLT